MSTIGDKIRELRTSKNLTQQELGDLLHIRKQTVYKWEKGINIPDSETLSKLASIFECTTDYLVGKSDIPYIKTLEDEDYAIKVGDYPHDLTPEEVSILINKLKEYRFDVDSLIKEIKKEKN